MEILETISLTDYREPVSVEVFHPKYGERNPTKVTRESCQLAQDVLKAAGWLSETTKEQQEQGG